MKMKAWKKILTGAVVAALLVTRFHAVTFQRETFAAHPDLKLWYDETSSQGQNILSAGSVAALLRRITPGSSRPCPSATATWVQTFTAKSAVSN